MFLATIGNKKPELFSRYEVSVTNYEETSIINTGTALYGRMFVEFFGTDDSRVTDINGQKSFDLLDFRIEYQKNDNVTKQQYPNSGWWDVKKNLDIPTLEYEAKSDSMVKEDYNVDLPYGSNDGIQPGYGILMNGNGTYMSTAPFAGVNERPEVHLANRIVGYWSTAKRRIECSLRTHDGTAATAAAGISPKKMVQIDGTTLYPYSISHKWRDDVVSLVTMQTEISEPPVVVTYMVSGVVTDGSNPLSGVVVTLGSLTTTTGSDGSYSFEDVDAGSYILSATKSGYTFTPISLVVAGDTTKLIEMLPYDAEVEYLESSGTQYIDTGINPQVEPNVIADITLLNTSDTDYWGNGRFSEATYIANIHNYRLRYYRYGSATYADAGTIGSGRHIVEAGKIVKIDGVLTYTSPNTYIPNQYVGNIFIFSSARQYPASFRLHSFKLYDGTTLVRDYIPVKVGQTGYLYDKVSGQLFGNAGTGSFTYGNDK